MSTHKVEFDAHKNIKKPTEVEFTTREGKSVDFIAQKNAKIRVRVKFKAKDRR
jgi:hypothetical protein